MTIGAIILSKWLEISSVGQLHLRDDRSAWVVRFVNFRTKVNTRSSRSGDDEISSSSRQFVFDYKVVNSALDNLLVSGSDWAGLFRARLS